MVVCRAAGRSITSNCSFGNRILNFLFITETRQPRVLNRIGSITVIRDCRGLSVNCRRQRQQSSQFRCRRTQSGLIISVNPLLRHLNIGQLVDIGVVDLITCVCIFNCSGCRLCRLVDAKGFVAAVRKFSFAKDKSFREISLSKGIGCTGGQVRETKVPSCFHIDGNCSSARCVIVAGVASLSSRTTDRRVLNCLACNRIIDRKPDVVI